MDKISYNKKNILIYSLTMAAIIEAVTCLFRFGLNLQSTRDTAWLSTITMGLRIHHGYIGIIAIACAFFIKGDKRNFWLTTIGLALVISDIIHHFAILWPITGAHQFDLFY